MPLSPPPPSSPPFHSSSPSPSTAPTTPPPPDAPETPTSPDDLFYSDSEPFTEPSDIPRLRSQHSTAGYREGLAASKSLNLQRGFDEGYSLGAVMGLKVGEMVGVLEGVVAALKSGGSGLEMEMEMGRERERERQEMEKLLGQARGELVLEKVFGAEYWGEDGIWKYAVGAAEGGEGGVGEVEGEEEEEEEEEVMFRDVVEQHPLIKMWSGKIENVVKRWDLEAGRTRWEEQRIES